MMIDLLCRCNCCSAAILPTKLQLLGGNRRSELMLLVVQR
jgi:hypothetical protein